jgi:hypothetical protein
MLTLEHRWNRLELFDVAHSVLCHHELEPKTIRVPTGVGQHPIGTAPEHVTHDRNIGGADGRQQTVLSKVPHAVASVPSALRKEAMMRNWRKKQLVERNWFLDPLTNRSRDNLPNPLTTAGNPYVPLNMPAIGDLFDMFDFHGDRNHDRHDDQQ